MRLWPRNQVAEELRRTNDYLALIAEVIQNPEMGFRSDGWYLNRTQKAVEKGLAQDLLKQGIASLALSGKRIVFIRVEGDEG